jgi:signal transduction histidine kinase
VNESLVVANPQNIRRSVARCLLGIIALAALTLVCFLLHLNVSAVGFLYLIVIVLLSLAEDFVSSIVSCIFASGCLAYFFAPPIFSLRVHESPNFIAIVAFLTTSLVISRLVYEVRTKSDEALASVNRKLADAEESERTRISRDFHSDIGPRLALLTIRLGQVEQDLRESNQLWSRIATTCGQASGISEDVHEISHELYSSKLEYLGITEAMRRFCREFAQQQKLEIDFRSTHLTTLLLPEISVCLYRVLQEALHNGMKHSGARRFEVELFGSSEAIHLAVHDAGVGFDPKIAIKGRGLGLTSMQERLKLVKGRLSIDSQPGRGTTIHAWVPLGNPHSEYDPQLKVS